MSCCCCCGGGFTEEPWSVQPSASDGGTTLEVASIDGLRYAGLTVGSKPKGTQIVKVIPNDGPCGACCTIIPDGFRAYSESMLSGGGELQPGCHCLVPFLASVSWLIPQQLIVYDSPAMQYETSNMIPVWISASITLKLKPDANLFELNTTWLSDGGGALSGRLKANMQEAVRTLAKAHKDTDILDVQGRDCKEQRLAVEEAIDADSKFFEVQTFIIQEVQIEPSRWNLMQEDVFIAVQTEMTHKSNQEAQIRQANNAEILKKREEAAVEQEHARKQAELTKAGIERHTTQITSETSKITAKMAADRDRTTEAMMNDAELEVAELSGKADQVKREVETTLAVEVNNLAAEGRQFVVDKETELAAKVAEDQAESAKLIGQSEVTGAEAQAKARKFEQDKAQLDIFSKLVENKKLRIASSAEVGARGMTFNDDRASQFVHSAMRSLHARFASTELAPAQEPLLK